MLEIEMMNDGYNYLLEKFDCKMAKQEVPFLSRCIDVVLVNQDDKVISIEFKISKWRHAIEQAVNHKLGADKAYICLPKRKISDKLSQALEKNEIGRLVFDAEREEKISVAIPAPENGHNVPIFKKLLLSNLNKI